MTSTTSHAARTGPAAGLPRNTPHGWRVVSSVVSTIMIVLVSIGAALAIVIAVATHFSRDGQYTAFGHPLLTVLSGSMSPVIRTGDLIVDDPVTPAQAGNLHVGQIISVLEAPGSLVVITHRIVGVRRTRGVVSYVTKGDANNAADSLLRPASDVVGVFSFAIPRGGYVLADLHRPLVLGLLVASPVLWFGGLPLYRLAQQMDERQPGKQAESVREGRGRHRHAR